MVNKCKICGSEFEKRISLVRHITVKYGKCGMPHVPILVYRCEYENCQQFSKINLRKMYKSGLSTPMMSLSLNVNKKTLLDTFKYYGIKTRNMSEATKNQIKRDGLWNKGVSKFDHPSMMQISVKRRGKNNPFYTAPGFEKRKKKNAIHMKRISSLSIKSRHPKSTEIRICTILNKEKIYFIRNFCLKHNSSWRLFDFYISELNLLIETHGNYFHANPKMYNKNDTIIQSGKRVMAQDIWAYDLEKGEAALGRGYKFLTLWESDIKSLSDSDICMIIKNSGIKAE